MSWLRSSSTLDPHHPRSTAPIGIAIFVRYASLSGRHPHSIGITVRFVLRIRITISCVTRIVAVPRTLSECKV
ncbi:hypothetical protein OESDEN_23187 [Oesophagostomum dentatum]|uniref:Uncharacterized protein n=1 Tax=Oesophagostomum dentatum TaxID=61180 RepID=A0A0B1RVV5_OESDE|nr:hypothetical protein OESDEN_23187 [Oesophagostomum dentatum]